MAKLPKEEVDNVLNSLTDTIGEREDLTPPLPQLGDLGFGEKYFGNAGVEFQDLPSSIMSTDYTDMIYNKEISNKAHAKIMNAYALDFGDEDVKKVIENNIPNITFTKDRFDNVIGNIPRQGKSDYRFYINPVGIQTPDVIRFTGQVAQYLRADKAMKLVDDVGGFVKKKTLGIFDQNSFIGRSLRGAGVMGTVGAAQDVGLELSGAEKDGFLGTPVSGEKLAYNTIGVPIGLGLVNTLGIAFNKSYSGLKSAYNSKFPKYIDSETGLPSQLAETEIKKGGFTIQNIKGDDGTFEKIFIDKKNREYRPDDPFIKNVTTFLEAGEDIDKALLFAKGKELGIPLLSSQVNNPQEKAVLISVLSGAFGRENRLVAEQILEIQSDGAVRALANKLGMTNKKQQDEFLANYKELSNNSEQKNFINFALGENTKELVSNAEAAIGTSLRKRYNVFDDYNLRLAKKPIDNLETDLIIKIRSEYGKNWNDPATKEYLKEVSPAKFKFLSKAFDTIEQFKKIDGRVTTPGVLKEIRNIRKRLFNRANSAGNDERMEIMEYFHTVDDYVDNIQYQTLKKNPSQLGENKNAVLEELANLKDDYREFRILTGRPEVRTNSFNRKDKANMNTGFVADMLEDNLSSIEIGNVITNSINNKRTKRGIYNDLLNIEEMIKKQYPDNPEIATRKINDFKDIIKQSVHENIAYDSVVKNSKGVVDINPAKMQKAINVWKLPDNRKTWNWIHNNTGDEIFDSIDDLATNTNLRNQAIQGGQFGNPIDKGTELLNVSERETIKNLLQFQAYKYGQLEGLYGFKAINNILSSGDDDVGLAIQKAFDTNPTGRIGFVDNVTMGRGGTIPPIGIQSSPAMSNIDTSGIPPVAPENIGLGQSPVSDEAAQEYMKEINERLRPR